MNKIYLLTILLLTILLTNCGDSKKDIAEKLLKSSIDYSNKNDFNIAKLQLDSIIIYYKEQTEIVEEAKSLLAKIELQEQERNLNYVDSLLVASENNLKPLLKNFIESDEYGTQKVLIHKRQRPENSYNRTFLKVNLDMDGNFHISSIYNGEKYIFHDQIKVYYNKKSALSSIVKEDGFRNRRFDEGETKWEIVNYKDGYDNGVVDFIANNWEDPLRVQFMGKNYEYILMEKFDREAIRDGYEISFILKDIKRLKEEKERITKIIKTLE